MAASRYRCTDVEPVRSVGTVPGMVATHAIRPSIEHHHRDIQTGSARAAVFGVSRRAGVERVAHPRGGRRQPPPGVVRLAGLAGLIAGAVSMAAGEYISMRAQTELFERELEMERRELERNPHVETVELTHIYEARGVRADPGPRAAPRT